MPSLENEYISGLQRAYESGEFVVTAEIGPPMSSNASHVERVLMHCVELCTQQM